MRLGLVPESGRRDIRLLVVVASVMTPSQILYRDLQVLVEAYRVKDMPAVQSESGHRTVQPVGTDYLVHAGIRVVNSWYWRVFWFSKLYEPQM